MSSSLIVDQGEFEELCQHIQQAGIVAFDTEFVSEESYQPELCLLQFKTPERCVAVDPHRVYDLKPWWDLMTNEETTIIIHGGQAEIRFCLYWAEAPPQKIIDIQLAEGLLTTSYPVGYSTLVLRNIGKKLSNSATRTDWRKRPLTKEQIKYALADVEHVLDIWKLQETSLAEQNRLEWAHTEFQRMVDELTVESKQPGWLRLSGISKLNRRELGVLAELYDWRETEAEQRNRLPRKIMRDDLLLELARRQPKTEKQLLATRDLNRTNYRKVVPQLLQAIDRGQQISDEQLPKLDKRNMGETPNEQILGKLLSIALANRCAHMNVAMQLVATTSDLRDLVRHHVYGEKLDPLPKLSEGWRAKVCGDLLTDLLDGKVSLRIDDPKSDAPLIFDVEQP